MNKIVALALLALACCESTGGTSEEISKLRGSQVSTTQRASPTLSAQTPGISLIPIIPVAGAVARQWGDELTKANDIRDPRQRIQENLLAILTAQIGARPVEAPIALRDDEPQDQILNAPPQNGYILDLETKHWYFAAFGLFNSNKYRVSYNIVGRIISASDNRIIAEANCFLPRATIEPAPSLDDLLAERAEKLKAILSKVETDCTKVLARELLGIT
jgi:hypothetical protein